jgi:hypothetical protein
MSISASPTVVIADSSGFGERQLNLVGSQKQ